MYEDLDFGLVSELLWMHLAGNDLFGRASGPMGHWAQAYLESSLLVA